MDQAVVLGPLSFPLGMLLALAAMVLGPLAGDWMARRTGVDIGSIVFRMMVAGLLAARLAYVVQYWDAYSQAPLSMLDVRDGGWRPWVGVAAAVIAAVVVGARRPSFRKPLAAAFGAAGLVWLIGTLALDALSNEQGTLPTASLRALGGENVALSSFAGKPTVVNLWATWCPPCRREMPVLQQAQATRPDVNFVFLNQGESAEKVRAFLAAQHWPLQNVLLDARGELAGQLGVRGLPTTLFYDAAGHLVDVRVGELSRATLAQRLGGPKIAAPPESN